MQSDSISCLGVVRAGGNVCGMATLLPDVGYLVIVLFKSLHIYKSFTGSVYNIFSRGDEAVVIR